MKTLHRSKGCGASVFAVLFSWSFLPESVPEADPQRSGGSDHVPVNRDVFSLRQRLAQRNGDHIGWVEGHHGSEVPSFHQLDGC